MNWLTVVNLIKFHQSKLIHSILHTGTPQYLYDRLTTLRLGVTRSSDNDKLGTRPRTIGQSQLTRNTFISKAFDTYNSLPGIITVIPTSNIFKIRLRRYLIDETDIPHETDKYYSRCLTTSASSPLSDRIKRINRHITMTNNICVKIPENQRYENRAGNETRQSSTTTPTRHDNASE